MRSLFLFFFVILSCELSVAQCVSEFKLKSLSPSESPELSPTGNGRIAIEFETKSAFTCQLYSYVNVQKNMVVEKKGFGASTLEFGGLSNKPYYRVTVTFDDETDPFCKTRMIDSIDLTGKRK